METQTLINYLVLFSGATGGWILKVLWDSIHELKTADIALAEKVGSIEIMVAGSYITRSEFQQTITAMFTKLDRIEDKVSLKADR
jgi:hypothetical protein